MLFPLKDYNPTRRTAYLTIALIVVNCLVFLYQSFLSPKPFPYHIAEYSMVPYEVTHMKNVTIPVGRDRWGRTVTFEREVSPIAAIFASLFMHASLMHLVGNML
ncbi:MAG: hypothetical protein GY765_40495, partial [bacterium]|nr:hypothetical protein [bacterium]